MELIAYSIVLDAHSHKDLGMDGILKAHKALFENDDAVLYVDGSDQCRRMACAVLRLGVIDSLEKNRSSEVVFKSAWQKGYGRSDCDFIMKWAVDREDNIVAISVTSAPRKQKKKTTGALKRSNSVLQAAASIGYESLIERSSQGNSLW